MISKNTNKMKCNTKISNFPVEIAMLEQYMHPSTIFYLNTYLESSSNSAVSLLPRHIHILISDTLLLAKIIPGIFLKTLSTKHLINTVWLHPLC